jgi:putative transposase
MRKVKFIDGEYYHIYNRGVDKRDVFLDEDDYGRFLTSMKEFNRSDPIGSLAEMKFARKSGAVASESNSLAKTGIFKNEADFQEGIGFRTPSGSSRLVDFIAYCLIPNHYHFILRQLIEDGISNFMHKIGLGYTNYFNLKNERSGALFQGRFKAVKIESDEHLLWVAAYVNGNAQIHGLIPDACQYEWCSYPEYLGFTNSGICNENIILDKYKSVNNFKNASEDCIKQMKERKDLQRFILD